MFERAADLVHRHRQRLVRLGRDRAERHRAGGEALHDLGRRARRRRASIGSRSRNASCPRSEPCARGRVGGLDVAPPLAALQRGDRVRVPAVALAAAPPAVEPADRQYVARVAHRAPRARAPRSPSRSPSLDGVPVKWRSISSGREPDRLEHLRAAVGRDRRDAHLRHRLQQALPTPKRGRRSPSPGAMSQPVHRVGAVADQARDVVDLARLGGEGGGGAAPSARTSLPPAVDLTAAFIGVPVARRHGSAPGGLQPRMPCFKLGIRMGDDTFTRTFALAGRPGAYLRIIQPGMIEAGDQIRVVPASRPSVLVGALASGNLTMDELIAVAADDRVPEGWRLYVERELARREALSADEL